MKKFFCWSILRNAALLAVALSTIFALVNLVSFDGNTFFIGFPSRFITIYLDKFTSPAFHISLSGVALDVLLAYAVCLFFDVKKK